MKPYRITRNYTVNGVTKTYTSDFATLDRVQKSLFKLIDDSIHYTFNRHKLVATKADGTIVTCELRNELHPCIIPISELLESFQVDPKFKSE